MQNSVKQIKLHSGRQKNKKKVENNCPIEKHVLACLPSIEPTWSKPSKEKQKQQAAYIDLWRKEKEKKAMALRCGCAVRHTLLHWLSSWAASSVVERTPANMPHVAARPHFHAVPIVSFCQSQSLALSFLERAFIQVFKRAHLLTPAVGQPLSRGYD